MGCLYTEIANWINCCWAGNWPHHEWLNDGAGERPLRFALAQHRKTVLGIRRFINADFAAVILYKPCYKRESAIPSLESKPVLFDRLPDQFRNKATASVTQAEPLRPSKVVPFHSKGAKQHCWHCCLTVMPAANHAAIIYANTKMLPVWRFCFKLIAHIYLS